MPLTKRESIGERRDGDKKMRRTQEKFLEAMQERVLALNLHVWGRKAQFNGLDRSFTKKMTASIKDVKTSYVTVKTTSKEDQEIKRKQRRTIEPA